MNSYPIPQSCQPQHTNKIWQVADVCHQERDRESRESLENECGDDETQDLMKRGDTGEDREQWVPTRNTPDARNNKWGEKGVHIFWSHVTTCIFNIQANNSYAAKYRGSHPYKVMISITVSIFSVTSHPWCNRWMGWQYMTHMGKRSNWDHLFPINGIKSTQRWWYLYDSKFP